MLMWRVYTVTTCSTEIYTHGGFEEHVGLCVCLIFVATYAAKKPIPLSTMMGNRLVSGNQFMRCAHRRRYLCRRLGNLLPQDALELNN